MTLNFDKLNGLIPAVVQDADDGTVLMAGFMNHDALDRTIAGKRVTFWSRSKQRLWTKGETSGNYLNVLSIHHDCDEDALLILARPAGPVCHTGEKSCFSSYATFNRRSTLQKLEEIIMDRKLHPTANSYTAKLFSEGAAKIAQKVGEEAVELALAAQYPDKQRIIEETADLLYHTLVLLAGKEISLGEVHRELEKRMKQQGEKGRE
ncbi:MAG: bifunctional phosphoribosyl-AMP cyclohydrolase/phosphoribosyl-ATP diphosphatase HisIE [Ignavibacteriae bacterium]|nr:bifunctional phosphoribosyl-AMP cyclohydrolase/phosphoribosyl-ATP diphosphatase HisIE [Ignavibacteria bacterium]MBI3365643.1 bifunctional phosphoribosyl-AMP cyclohydrolase/phosphoribosyl-ATP diphosphatase HisIE [Ignavibacteriota bacterium]